MTSCNWRVDRSTLYLGSSCGWSFRTPLIPRVRVVTFGDRIAYEQRQPGTMVWSCLPDDFGKAGYGRRRASVIRKHLSTIPDEIAALDWAFDLWLGPSEKLRQYLWAHNEQPVQTARQLIHIIPASALKT